jgi:hypothetical protein
LRLKSKKSVRIFSGKIPVLAGLVLLSVLLASCKSKNEDEKGTPIHPLQEIVFECYYINYAWGYIHQGFFIDRNGLIHEYSEHEISHVNSSWNFPDNNGYITEEALKENMGKTQIAETRIISTDELHKYTNLIALVKDNDYSEYQQGADMGAIVNSCYLFDDKTHTYKEILLRQEGDLIRINNNSAAKIIDEWLNTIEIETIKNIKHK